MKKKKRKSIKKILNLTVWLELLLIIIGVIIGITLTNFYEDYQLHKTYKKATKQIKEEIISNQNNLEEFNKQLTEKFDAYRIVEQYFDKDLKVFVPKDSIESFKEQVKSVVRIDSILDYSKNLYRIQGDFEIQIGSILLGGKLKSSVWDTFSKQQSFLTITDFDFIASLENLYAYQTEVNEQTKNWKKSFYYNLMQGEKEREDFLIEWFLLVGNQKSLIEMYKFNISELEFE